MNEIQKQYASANSLVIDLKEVASIQWIVIPDELDDNRVISVRFYLRGHGQYFNRRTHVELERVDTSIQISQHRCTVHG